MESLEGEGLNVAGEIDQTIPAAGNKIVSGETLEHQPDEQALADPARGFDEQKYRQIAREEAIKAAQSFTDKLSERMNKTIRERFEGLERNQHVLGLSDEQVEAAKKKIVEEERNSAVMSEVHPTGGDPRKVGDNQAAEADGGGAGQLHPVIATALSMMKDEGVFIEEGDPEFGQYLKPMIDKGELTGTFLAASTRAIDAKRARLEGQKRNAAVRNAGGVDGRVASNDISGITDSKTLYLMGERALRKK